MIKRLLTVSLAGAITGALSAYAFRPHSPAALLAGFLAGAALLVLLWLASAAGIQALLDRSDDHLSREEVQRLTVWPLTAFALLPILHLPFTVFQSRSAPLAEMGSLSNSWQTLMVLSLSVLLVYFLLAYRFPALRRGPVNLMTRRPAVTLGVMGAVWLAAASIMDITKLDSMHGGGNTSMFVDALNNVFSQKGTLYSSMFHGDGASVLGLHSSFIWYFVFPFYRIWPSFEWLLILSNVALVLTIIPIYGVSRRYFGVGTSLAMAAVFLLNRTILSQPGAGDMSEERFLPVLLLGAFYFWQSERFLPFMGLSLLAMSVREDVGIVIFLFGLVGLLWRRRRPQWWAVPMLVGGAWFVSMVYWLIPHMSPPGEGSEPLGRAMIFYGDLGSSKSEVMLNLLKPWVFLKTMLGTSGHIVTVYGIWQSFGFGVFLLSSTVVLAIPATAEILLLKHPTLTLFNANALAGAIFISFIMGTLAADRIFRRWKKRSIAAVLTIATLFATAALFPTWFTMDRYEKRYNYDTAMSIMNQLPPDASVFLPLFMMIKAQPGQDVRGYYQVPYEVSLNGHLTVEQDYVVIDASDIPADWLSERFYQGQQLLTDQVSSSPEFGKVFDGDDLQLFVRCSKLPDEQRLSACRQAPAGG